MDDQICDIEEEGGCQQSEREDDQHLMDGMPEESCLCLHKASL